jgi:glycosyltransferase involved in cell wall biosynthesis
MPAGLFLGICANSRVKAKIDSFIMCDHTTMHIAFVIPYFYPALGYGGTPRLAYDMARALARRGHQLTVFTTDAGGESRIPKEIIEKIRDNGLDGMRISFYRNLSNSLAYRQRVFFPSRFLWESSALLAGNEVVHIHDLRSFLGVAAHHAARASGTPYVLSPHGGLKRLGKESAKLVFDTLWGKAILQHAAALCAISPLEERDAKALGIENRRIHLFPPGINADEYKTLPPRGRFASRWGLQDRRIILFLGRLHWIKGADVLIEAVGLIPKLKDLHLVIAGLDDGAESQLKSLVVAKRLENRVTFTGLLDGTDRLGALVDSEIVAIPSRREGFPLAALEALASQTPVILTSACDLGDWMQNQPGLVTFRSGDAHDLAEKIKARLCHRPEPKAMLDGSNFILNNFSLDALAQKAERLYQSLI